MRMGLQERGTGANDLPTLAPHIAWRTDLRQTPLRWWQIRTLRQSALSCSLSSAIEIEDAPSVSLPIPQTPYIRLWSEASKRILEEHAAQCFHRGLVQRGKEATQRGTMRQLIASEQSHKRAAKWLQALVIRFECWFTTNGIAHQHDHKVNHFEGTEPLAGEANTLGDFRNQAQPTRGVAQTNHFSH